MTQLQAYATAVKNKKITVESNIEENMQLKCNPELIALVIDNYLSNAVKNSPENGLIRFNVQKERRGIRLSVYNRGEHINNEDKKHIWEEFYKQDKARTTSGGCAGMGLATCKQILKLHRFKYGFKNTTDGVEFWFFAHK